ncbi:MAG: carboxyl transferase [Eubacterium sp.]|nr:carboxyl transferase [Eubacterium sp.]
MSSMVGSPAAARIEALLDPGSFVEIGAAVTARSTDFNLSDKKQPSDGVITGYGLINESLVYVYSQDFSVMKGTVGEMHAKKIVRIFDMAVKMGAPVIGLVDSAGMRLEEASDALQAFGGIYMAMSNASGVVPVITGIFGTCGGGMALIPALSDFVFMEAENAKLFVNSPNAIPENYSGKVDTDSAAFQSGEAGMVDVCGTEAEILASMRSLAALLPANNEDEAYDEPSDDLNRLISDAAACAADPALLIPRLADGQLCFEAKAAYGKDMVTALAKIGGSTVGIVANRTALYDAEGNETENYGGQISARGARKAAAFVKFCDAFSIPVVTLTNARSFKATQCSETHIAKAAAELISAFTGATTAKINVITGEAFGSAGLVMNSHAVGADLVYAWEDAKCGMMDASAAAKIMYDGAGGDVIAEQAAAYDALQNSVEAAAARGYVDTVIAPEETRKYLIGAIEMLFTKREFRPDKKHGTV